MVKPRGDTDFRRWTSSPKKIRAHRTHPLANPSIRSYGPLKLLYYYITYPNPMPHTHDTPPTPVSRPSFMGANVGFRLAVAALCLGLLWLAVIWALA